jgi:predicted amidohydrolase YtcJ
MTLKTTAASGLVAAILLVACSQDDVEAATASTPSTTGNIALINGKVYTVNDKQPWAEAVVIKAGKIVFVGTSADAKKQIDGTTETIDLQGKMVMPGIEDSHMHPLEAGSDVVSCILNDEESINAQLPTIKACKDDDSTGTDWILGWGHSLHALLDATKTKTPVQILDELIPDRPIAIMESTSHSIWVNSAALELAKIDKNTPNPQGGAILKDADGEPNGILLDTAGDLVIDLAFKPTPELKKANYAGLLKSLKQVAQNGITSMVEARLYWKRDYLEAYDQAEREGKLTARTNISVWAYPTMNDAEQLKAIKGMYRDNPNSLVRVNQIKIYDDGILHNTTAALLSPYKTTLNGVGSNVGLSYFTQERLTRYVTELEKVGYDMHIHTIGDRGVRESLNAIEAAQNTNNSSQTRHRLTHVEMVSPSDIPRFAKLGVIADFQVAGDFALPANYAEVEPLIGERAYSMLPVRSIYDTGATVTLSSDWDVSTLNPFVGMQHALQLGKQSLPNLDAVIDAYTINAAYLMRQDTRTGSLEVGKLGDVIVLDQNIFNVPVANIGKTKVLLTLLGGKSVYRSVSLK